MILVIHDPIYQQEVIVAIAEPGVKGILRKVAREGYHVDDPDEMGRMLDLATAQARTVMDPDSGAVVIRLKHLRRGYADDLATLVHECVHAATMLFDRVGFPLKSKTDEPLAYYVAFLVRSVLSSVASHR